MKRFLVFAKKKSGELSVFKCIAENSAKAESKVFVEQVDVVSAWAIEC